MKHGRTYANLPEVDEVFTIGMNRAVEVIANKFKRGGATQAPLKELGEHPEGGPMSVMAGRYGPYVKWGKVYATLPKGVEPTDVTFDEALVWVAEKAAKKGAGKAKAKPKAKAAAKPKSKAAAKPKTAAKTKAKAKPKAKPADES